MKKLKKWFSDNQLNIISVLVFLPSILSIVALLFQGFYFSFTGEWFFIGVQLFFGSLTSVILTLLSYKLYGIIKLLKDAR